MEERWLRPAAQPRQPPGKRAERADTEQHRSNRGKQRGLKRAGGDRLLMLCRELRVRIQAIEQRLELVRVEIWLL